MARPIDFIVVIGLVLFTIALILSGITHPWARP
jgi:hypothetical protein